MEFDVNISAGDDLSWEIEGVEFPAVPQEGNDLVWKVEHKGDTIDVTATVVAVVWFVDDDQDDDGEERKFAWPVVFAEVLGDDDLRQLGLTPAINPDAPGRSPRRGLRLRRPPRRR